MDRLDLLIVLVADPFYLQHTDESWWHERANLDVLGKFIQSLPAG